MSDLPATLFVLYGATGDLAKRMVLPAFFDLYARGLLPRRWKLIGNGRGMWPTRTSVVTCTTC